MIQIIHPFKEGQVIANINIDSVGLSEPKKWVEIGWGEGSHEAVKKTGAFDKVFPLKNDQEYAVVSRLSPGGSWELLIDGKLVAHGQVKHACPVCALSPCRVVAPMATVFRIQDSVLSGCPKHHGRPL